MNIIVNLHNSSKNNLAGINNGNKELILTASGSGSNCIGDTDVRRPHVDGIFFSGHGYGEWNEIPGKTCAQNPEGYRTPGGQGWVTSRGDGWVMQCFKSNYGDDINTKVNCCRDVLPSDRVAKECDPKWCKGSPECRYILFDFCTRPGNLNSAICDRLKEGGSDADPVLYNEIVDSYCVDKNTDGSRFKEPICQEYCLKNRTTGRCMPRLKEVCSTKTPELLGKVDKTSSGSVIPADDWGRICGCYYPDSIYNTFRQDLESKWNLPPIAFTSPRTCYFPYCGDAHPAFQESNPKDCPPQSIVTCLNRVSIDQRGAIVKQSDIYVTQNPQCSNQYTRKSSDSDSTTTCTSDANCSLGKKCKNGVCVADETKPSGGGLPLLAIISIIIGSLLILVIILILVFKPRSTTTSTTKKTKSATTIKRKT